MMMTERDIRLFTLIGGYGMLSTKQINESIFKGVATTTVLRRLRRLEKANFIKRLMGLESQEILWLTTPKAMELIGGEQFKRSWNKNLLEHDHKLVGLRLKLEGSGIIDSWVPEQEIRSLVIKKYGIRNAGDKLVPDALLVVQQNRQKVSVALELELTLKNRERMRDIFKRYLEKKDLGLIWYISDKKSILNSLLTLWSEGPGKKSSIKLVASIFDEVMENPCEATLYHLGGKLKIGDIWERQGAHSDAHRVSTHRLDPSQSIPQLTYCDQRPRAG